MGDRVQRGMVSIRKEEAADILQNDVNQTLAAVLLCVQSTIKENHQLIDNSNLKLAETYLRQSIAQLVQLHYDLLAKPGSV